MKFAMARPRPPPTANKIFCQTMLRLCCPCLFKEPEAERPRTNGAGSNARLENIDESEAKGLEVPQVAAVSSGPTPTPVAEAAPVEELRGPGWESSRRNPLPERRLPPHIPVLENHTGGTGGTSGSTTKQIPGSMHEARERLRSLQERFGTTSPAQGLPTSDEAASSGKTPGSATNTDDVQSGDDENHSPLQVARASEHLEDGGRFRDPTHKHLVHLRRAKFSDKSSAGEAHNPAYDCTRCGRRTTGDQFRCDVCPAYVSCPKCVEHILESRPKTPLRGAGPGSPTMVHSVEAGRTSPRLRSGSLFAKGRSREGDSAASTLRAGKAPTDYRKKYTTV
jgi:hypothetical protein